MDRRLDRGVATRQHIIAQATQLFTDEGYDAVSIETILKTCGISRGALYHHFASKEAVFAACLEAVEVDIVEHLTRAGRDASNPLDSLRAGCSAWLGLAEKDATVRRIVLTDAPSVIGWDAWRKMDEAYTLGLIRNVLSAAAATGRLDANRVDIYAHMLLAVLVEVALLIARSPDDTAASAIAAESVEHLISSLMGSKPHARWVVPQRTPRRAESPVN